MTLNIDKDWLEEGVGMKINGCTLTDGPLAAEGDRIVGIKDDEGNVTHFTLEPSQIKNMRCENKMLEEAILDANAGIGFYGATPVEPNETIRQLQLENKELLEEIRQLKRLKPEEFLDLPIRSR